MCRIILSAFNCYVMLFDTSHFSIYELDFSVFWKNNLGIYLKYICQLYLNKSDYIALANIPREGKWKERLIASLSFTIPSTISPGALGLSNYSKCVIAFDEYQINDRPRFYLETVSRLSEIFSIKIFRYVHAHQ